MKKIYVLITIVFMSIASTSCTADSVTDELGTEYAEEDTGGQNGTLSTPPPPPKP